MKFLLDTHLLLWAGISGDTPSSPSLSVDARALIDDATHRLYFSPASVWEVAIKKGVIESVGSRECTRRGARGRELGMLMNRIIFGKACHECEDCG